MTLTKTADNEDLIAAIQGGDMHAKEIFVEKNSPLIYSIIKRFSKNRVSMDDLYQIGCVGLMKALNNFDLKYQVKFSTYAVPIIMGEIKRFFRDDGSMRVSRSLKEGYLSMCKCRDELMQKLDHEPTFQEIAKAMSLEVGDVILAFEANQFIYSLDEPIYENDGSPIHLEDKVPSKAQDVVMKLSLDAEIQKLEQRERLLLHYRYECSMKQDEIAKRMGISQVQVSRLEKRILEKLKHRLINT
ncbi:MAG: SigB/SigF/SigG family RNA polymerase sigma factor [Erysipelotrichaceae bacterium]|jgi:RNA polymerase sporulation-specific sigma factor|nr:SigB/SigF/SigG family RNA polymerase sigma factor [Erysipelotrichaceae bacterium]